MKKLKNDGNLKSFPYLRIWIDILPHLWRGWKKWQGLQKFSWFEDLDSGTMFGLPQLW